MNLPSTSTPLNIAMINSITAKSDHRHEEVPAKDSNVHNAITQIPQMLTLALREDLFNSNRRDEHQGNTCTECSSSQRRLSKDTTNTYCTSNSP